MSVKQFGRYFRIIARKPSVMRLNKIDDFTYFRVMNSENDTLRLMFNQEKAISNLSFTNIVELIINKNGDISEITT